jgi:hypothetical protein
MSPYSAGNLTGLVVVGEARCRNFELCILPTAQSIELLKAASPDITQSCT